MRIPALSQWKVRLAFAPAILTLLVVGALTYRGMVLSSESDRWVLHTHEVLENFQDLLLAMGGIQSSIRGFVLTGKESYLESYRASKLRVEQHQVTIRNLTADNPEQHRQLPALASVAAENIRHSEMLIGLLRAKGLEAAADTIRNGSGQRTMVEFEALVRQLQDEELRLLAQREVDAKRRLSQTKIVLILGIFLSLLITITAASSVQRDSSRRDLADAKYRGLLEAAPDAMVVVNQDGEIVLLNDQAEKQFGYHRDELVGRKVTNVIPEGFAERLLADGLRSAEDALAQQIGTGIELTGRRKNGSEFPIEIMLSPLESAGEILVTAAIRDISVRKEAVDRIRGLNRVYAVLSGINALIVRVRGRDELFREACRIAVEDGRFKMAWIGVVDRNAMKIVPIASAGAEPEFLTLLKKGLFSLREDAPLGNTLSARAVREKKATVSNEIRGDTKIFFAKDRVARGIHSIAVLPLLVADDAIGVIALYAGESGFFDDEEIKLLTEMAGDIAFAIDHIQKVEKLDYLAYYDSLTGLANRALFYERLEQSVRNAAEQQRKLALVLLDIERFKNINDTLGRQAGDALLKDLAARVSGYAKDVGRLGRIDADHFAVLVQDVQTAEDLAHLIEQRFREVFGPPFRIGDSELRVTAKFGIAMFPGDGADADTLFRNAEAALKKAKRSGERYLFYTQAMNERVAEKLTLENQLRQALDKEEFVLHYQPKVDLARGKLTGAEALIRWNDPRTGLVPPGRFIPVLEETGLIDEVGRWALRQAIEDYLHWRSAGLDAVRIAVNVSPLQLRNPGFIAEIRQAIDIDAHAAAGLELEITESLIMEDVKHSIASLQAIRAMGVYIAIDDFGTGFSSLSYLAKLPVDTLKIDRSFVIDMTAGPQGLALVSTIINLAHSLKLKVVAEGVETEEQSHLLRLLKCDEMQGFIFSQPVPGEIFKTGFLAPSPAA